MSLAAALAALSDTDLERLRELADDSHGRTVGLLTAISHAVDWEWHRRRGVDFPMLPLAEAIGVGDLDVNQQMAAALAERLGDMPAMTQLIEAIVGEITTAQRRH